MFAATVVSFLPMLTGAAAAGGAMGAEGRATGRTADALPGLALLPAVEPDLPPGAAPDLAAPRAITFGERGVRTMVTDSPDDGGEVGGNDAREGADIAPSPRIASVGGLRASMPVFEPVFEPMFEPAPAPASDPSAPDADFARRAASALACAFFATAAMTALITMAAMTQAIEFTGGSYLAGRARGASSGTIHPSASRMG
jgi:hypothetical protein